MLSAREQFLEGTRTVAGSAVITFSLGPVIVLVLEDAADEELAAAIVAEQGRKAGERFAGRWAVHADEEGDVARFELIEREGGIERQWALPDWPAEVLEVGAAGAHLVAVLPRGEDGEMPALASADLAGSMIVEAEASEPLRRLLDLR